MKLWLYMATVCLQGKGSIQEAQSSHNTALLRLHTIFKEFPHGRYFSLSLHAIYKRLHFRGSWQLREEMVNGRLHFLKDLLDGVFAV